jgi:hypothetical protein
MDMYDLETYKMKLISKRLVHFNGHRTKAAKSLGITYRGMHGMLERMKEKYPDLYEKIPTPDHTGGDIKQLRKNKTFKHHYLWDEEA